MATIPNAFFGFPNLAIPDYWTPTISGGNWLPDTPLSSMLQDDFAYKVRSRNCLGDSTQFVVDLGALQLILAVAVPRSNMLPSTAPTAVCNVYSDAALTTLVETSTIDIYPATYAWGSLPFEHSSWLDGRLTDEAARFTPQPLLFLFDTAALGRYVEILISDPDNAAGYVELTPPIYVCPGYQPTINVKYGAQIGADDPSVLTKSLGGKRFVDGRPIGRIFAASIDYLPQNEAFSQFLDMQIRLGVKYDMLFSYMPADTANLGRVTFPAFLTKLDPLTAAAFGFQSVAISIEEKIA